MTPRENYTIYLSIAFDLEPWNPLIHNTIPVVEKELFFSPGRNVVMHYPVKR